MRFLPNTIIVLHEIHDQKWLNKAFEILKKNYNIIPIEVLDNFYTKLNNIKNSCHITFDDGDISFYNNVLPLIKKHNIPVSTYVSPLMAVEQKNFWFQEIRGYNQTKLIEIADKVTNNKNNSHQKIQINSYLKSLKLEVIWEIIKLYQKETNTPLKQPLNMNVNQLKEVKDSGLVEIGAHTLNHPILINENDEIAKYEIEKSIDDLGVILDSKINYFVYPNGNYGLREIEILKGKDIKLAFTTQRAKISLTNNQLSIPRSGSPLISESNNLQLYNYSRSIFQYIVGEDRYSNYSKKIARLF